MNGGWPRCPSINLGAPGPSSAAAEGPGIESLWTQHGQHQSAANNQLVGYAYDAAGNMTNDGSYSYTYDAEGNITAVVGSGTTATYVYNALGQRVKTVVGSATTEYVFSAAGQRVSEWNGTTRAQLKGKYYWGGKPVAYYTTAASGSAGAHFEHQDWLGTERLRTTYNGGVEGSFTSLPWGDNQTPVANGSDANHYAQLDHDSETNTDHAQFRQYSNTQGRFLSPDPYSGSYDMGNPQSMNRYVYAMNSPLGNIDPSGLNCYWDDGTDDGSPEDGGATKQECADQGGTWIDNPTETSSVNGNIPRISLDYITYINSGYVGISYVGGVGGGAPNNPAQPCHCFNTQAFANELNANANDGSTGWCGRYLGWALDAGGTPVGSHAGGDYGPYLTQAGFVTVPLAGYTPQQGDIAIFQRSNALGHSSGHAVGYTGSQWVSDFFQKYMSPYSPATTPPVTVYRSGCKC